MNGTVAADAAGIREIACDESGSDGENLTGGNTDVFAHASVLLSAESAAGHVQEIRNRIRSPAEEYKANHLLREKHRAVLEWLLSPSGPLHGRAHVHLVEKPFYIVDRAVDLLLGDPGAAVSLFGEGRRTFTEEEWTTFLEAANQLLWVRHDDVPDAPVPRFFDVVDVLLRRYPGTPATDVLARIAEERPRALSYRAGIQDGPFVLAPVLNPLLPSILHTAAHWSDGGRPVRLAHDRQNMLTPERIAWIEGEARRRGIRLAGLRLVVSRSDARVQLADFLAGIARRIASDELNGRGDPALSALLRPYTGAAAVWGDERSWARLGPARETVEPPAPVDSSVQRLP
ncbi:hypothetical protein [Streptomyces sp. NBC_00199]|uniref:hypothetical protein n=1 Tax=Streptomyces sp. NBC_00199 TaxID=2975678 RepID=UPI002250A701|nr:hypothetical protein [Streptomyces sp. NBC_00199]MCX5262904.1 hypothetical protein [Streptomyces sp. NBC_00199]